MSHGCAGRPLRYLARAKLVIESSLRGRVALVIGVSRRAAIGYAIARRLAERGAGLFLHHYSPHDPAQPWSADPAGPSAIADIIASIPSAGPVQHLGLDLADPDAPTRLIRATWTS